MILDIKNSLFHLNSIGYKEFYITYNDDYKFIPDFYISYNDIISELNNNLDDKRKEKWGMIFSK